MGFWDKLNLSKGKKTSEPRVPAIRKTPPTLAEREGRLRLQYLRELKSRDPETYGRFMNKVLGDMGERRDPIDELANQIKRLQGLGIVNDVKAVDEDRSSDWLKVAAAYAPLVMAAFQQGQQRPAPEQQLPPGYVPTTVTPVQQYQIAAPQPQPVQQPAPAPEPEVMTAEELEMLPMMSQLIIGQLKGKTPTEAAKWLLEQKHPDAKKMVLIILSATDEQIPDMLPRIGKTFPVLAGLAEWLERQPDWTLNVAREVRRQSGGGQQAKSVGDQF